VTRTILVLLGEDARPVGTLHYDRQGARQRASFTYDPSWRAAARPWPIDPALPLVAGQQFRKPATTEDSVFHGIIADTEPDGWGRRVIMRDHQKRRQLARARGTEPPAPLLGALDFLLGVDDVGRLGALRFQDETGAFCRTPEAGARRTPALIELPQLVAASHRLERNTETAQDLDYLRGRGTSLGGLRPKCSVLEADGTLAIGKFPSVADTTALTKAEVLALRLARRAGIDAAEARLESSDGVDVAVVRRFDRIGPRRLLYASAATMLQAEPSDGRPFTYMAIADVLRRHGDAPRRDIRELWRRIAFSILITNVDDHLHNHGFLHVADGRWRLSPAFDINPFPDRARESKTWISEDSGAEMAIDALWAAAPYFELAPAEAAGILREVEAAVARWREEARRVGMTAAEREPFTDAFEHRERDVARQLIAQHG
jgi:serine/threonine-protein kinase HipA